MYQVMQDFVNDITRLRSLHKHCRFDIFDDFWLALKQVSLRPLCLGFLPVDSFDGVERARHCGTVLFASSSPLRKNTKRNGLRRNCKDDEEGFAPPAVWRAAYHDAV